MREETEQPSYREEEPSKLLRVVKGKVRPTEKPLVIKLLALVDSKQ